MFISDGRTAYTNDGQQVSSGWYLIVADDAAAPLQLRPPLRALARKVTLRQCGQFMMGTTTIHGETIGVSGAFGNDGLSKSLPTVLFDQLNPIPDVIVDAFWAGDHATVRAWADANRAALRRTV